MLPAPPPQCFGHKSHEYDLDGLAIAYGYLKCPVMARRVRHVVHTSAAEMNQSSTPSLDGRRARTTILIATETIDKEVNTHDTTAMVGPRPGSAEALEDVEDDMLRGNLMNK